MPAPVPIRIRYDDAGLLGGLAGSAGSAVYGNQLRQEADQRAQEKYRLDYQRYLQQLASDQATVRDILNQKARAKELDASRAFQQDQFDATRADQQQANELQTAYQSKLLEESKRYHSGELANAAARIEAQRAATKSHERPPISLVPDSGPLGTQPTGTAKFEQDGNTFELVKGKVISYPTGNSIARDAALQSNQGAEPRGAFAAPEDTSNLVTPQVRSQLDYLRSLGIPEGDPMWVAAKSGGLKMDQLVDDVRQREQKRVAQDALQKQIAKDDYEIQAIDRIPDLNALTDRARRFLGMQDKFMYPDDQEVRDAYIAKKQEVAQRKAQIAPSNSSGRSPLGANDPVRQQQGMAAQTQPAEERRLSPAEAAALPSGTSFIGLDGVRRIKH